MSDNNGLKPVVLLWESELENSLGKERDTLEIRVDYAGKNAEA